MKSHRMGDNGSCRSIDHQQRCVARGLEMSELPPLEDDRVAMMLGLVPDKRTPSERLWDAIRTRGESLKYHYESPDNKGDNDGR